MPYRTMPRIAPPPSRWRRSLYLRNLFVWWAIWTLVELGVLLAPLRGEKWPGILAVGLFAGAATLQGRCWWRSREYLRPAVPAVEICRREHEDCNGALWECREPAHADEAHVWTPVTEEVRCLTLLKPGKRYRVRCLRCLRWRDHAGPCRW